MFISPQSIITLAALITALGVITGVVIKGYNIYRKLDTNERAIAEVKEEQTVVCYALFSILDGLKQQGCNGQVTEAHDRLQKHINLRAHE